MAQRVLPGVYVSLNDLSQLPEGQTSLTVGYVLKADRGPVNELNLVTSPTDFLTKYTFGGKPSLSSDATFWSILKVLARTNTLYVSRAANNPLYGGIVLRKSDEYGAIASASERVITVVGDITSKVGPGSSIMVIGTTEDEGYIDGYYTVETAVVSGEFTLVTVKTDLPATFTAGTGSAAKVCAKPGAGITSLKMGTTANVTTGGHLMIQGSNLNVAENAQVIVKGTENNGTFTIDSYTVSEGTYDIVTKEALVPEATVEVFYSGVTNVEGFLNAEGYTELTDGNVMLITGVDPGAYNGQLSFDIVSSVDNHEDLVYFNGADIGNSKCTFDTMRLTVRNGLTNEVLESYTFSLDPTAKAIDGSTLYVDEVVSGSAYIRIFHNETTDLPGSTVASNSVRAAGGSNGGTVEVADMEAALEPYKDKVVSVSILGNGCSTQAETKAFQQALMGIADTRKDCFVFLNAPKAKYKNQQLNSEKAQEIVKYKKNDLANTSFYGCMYAPFVKTSDTYNSREVEIGAEAIAIAGWLDVINSLSYPYAYAGPRNGLVQGVTCDWKIGDMSGEAQVLNDASINYVAFDGKVGRYYMQCQNTLQVANSSMRNIGTVLNVLDIKEHFETFLKEFLQLPITDFLRRDIIDTANDYLAPMVGVRFSNYLFQDVSSDFDIADNTLRYLLTIAPTPYAQKIYLVMNIVNATFDFSILQSM